jgi:ethanolamine utilization protein EutN
VLVARVSGIVVATPKADELDGLRLAVLTPIGADGQPRGTPAVAVDTLGAAEGQLVFAVSAAPARAVRGLSDRPVDLAVVGILDRAEGVPS